MRVIRSIKSLRRALRRLRQKKKTIGFVPTMGYFHEGHLSLMGKSKKDNDATVVSLFVNPTQFGPREDFGRYPQDKKRDESLAKKEKVDIIFYPSVKEIYPDRYLTYVDVKKIGSRLCGRFRLGHFRGVSTIVCKLLNIVEPHTLYLGQKDAQQAIIIKKMIEDLNIDVRLKICPIVREKDGLAMSSRNTYLTPLQRKSATVLYQSLKKAKRLIDQRQVNVAMIKNAMRRIIRQGHPTKIEYIECVDAYDLTPLKKIKGKALIALAVYFGKTRLIDNICVHVK